MSGINGFWGNSISMVEKSLDYLWEKQQAISNNIANAETPGYKSKYVTYIPEFLRLQGKEPVTGSKGYFGGQNNCPGIGRGNSQT